MKKFNQRGALLLVSVTILLTAGFSSVQAQTQDLIYVAVEPCRIVDTRNGLGLPVAKNQHRNFLVAGTSSQLFDQGGSQSGGCAAPKPVQIPAAIAAYVIAVPADSSVGNGALVAYPSDQPEPPVGAGSTVNFAQGQTIGNTTNIKLCSPAGCPADGQFAILSRNSDEHVVVDVQGYFYPVADGHQIITTETEVAPGSGVVSAFAACPLSQKLTGGGYWFVYSDSQVANVKGSAPSVTNNSWFVQFEVSEPGSIVVYAICENR